jgi:hypothetical protein
MQNKLKINFIALLTTFKVFIPLLSITNLTRHISLLFTISTFLFSLSSQLTIRLDNIYKNNQINTIKPFDECRVTIESYFNLLPPLFTTISQTFLPPQLILSPILQLQKNDSLPSPPPPPQSSIIDLVETASNPTQPPRPPQHTPKPSSFLPPKPPTAKPVLLHGGLSSLLGTKKTSAKSTSNQPKKTTFETKQTKLGVLLSQFDGGVMSNNNRVTLSQLFETILDHEKVLYEQVEHKQYEYYYSIGDKKMFIIKVNNQEGLFFIQKNKINDSTQNLALLRMDKGLIWEPISLPDILQKGKIIK